MEVVTADKLQLQDPHNMEVITADGFQDPHMMGVITAKL